MKLEGFLMYAKFVQIALGNLDADNFMPSAEEWKKLYDFSRTQSIIGITYQSLEIIYHAGQKPPFDILMEWVAADEQIAGMNKILNEQVINTIKELTDEDIDSCILKGQGNATFYPNPYSRTPGDIDIWVNLKRKDLISYVKGRYDDVDVNYHHIGVTLPNNINLEFHLFPMFLHNPFKNRKLQRFFDNERKKQMEHYIQMPGTKEFFPIPTVDFNIIYQLVHMKYHYLSGGIGMRQMIDYYYVLMSDGSHNKNYVAKALRNLGLWTFAGAVMYVMKEFLGIKETYLIAPVDERRGKSLLYSIIEGGNFGTHSAFSQKRQHSVGHTRRFVDFTVNNMKLFKEYPGDIVAETIFRFVNFIRVNYYRIKYGN